MSRTKIIFMICLFVFVTGCSQQKQFESESPVIEPPLKTSSEPEKYVIQTDTPAYSEAEEASTAAEPETVAQEFINPEGFTVKERFYVPQGYKRIESESGSFAEFLQNLPLKEYGTKVRYYDGREKTRDVYMAVVDYTLGDRDLQQCADAVIRLRAEYLYSANLLDKIQFNFVSGFCAVFAKWSQGYGISVDGNNVSWVRNSNNNTSYESFQKYLNMVYAYASTLSLEKELESKDIDSLAVGDVFIEGGSPGHCVIVVDAALHESSGEKLFMLAQSYMPAQDIQILKGNIDTSVWYTIKDTNKLITPEWVFEWSDIKTWQSFDN